MCVDDALAESLAERHGPADGTIDLGFAYMAPVLVGALGAILIVSGLVSRRRG
jgi:hypothetical protein